jgi:hypothetical protein
VTQSPAGGGRTSTIIVAAVLGVAVVAAVLAIGRPWIHSDGRAYYAMTLSLVVDGDLDVSNQRAEYPGAWFTPETGRWFPPWGPGFAVFYWPWLAPTVGLESVWEPLRSAALAMPSDGAPLPLSHALALMAGSIFYGTVAWFFSYRVCRLVAPPALSLGATGACFFASHLVGYVVGWPSFSQSLDAALVGVGTWLILTAAVRREDGLRRWLLAGCVFGAATATRFADVMLLVSAVIMAFLNEGGLPRKVRRALSVGAGALPWMALLIAFEWVMKGTPFAKGFRHLFLSWPKLFFHFLALPPDGLLQWSPVLAYSVAGWALLPRGGVRRSAFVLFVPFMLMLGFYGFGSSGAAYGARYLVQFLGLYALGLCSFWLALRRAGAAVRCLGTAGVAGTALYSCLLVALAWLPTPGLYIEKKPWAAPHQIIGNAVQAGFPLGSRWRPMIPRYSPLGLITGAWNDALRTGTSLVTRGDEARFPVPAVLRPLGARQPERCAIEVAPAVPGLPGISVLRLARPCPQDQAVAFSSGPGLRLLWHGGKSLPWRAEGLELFARYDPPAMLLLLHGSRSGGLDTLTWRGCARFVEPLATGEASPHVLDFVVGLWAASGMEVLEGADPSSVNRGVGGLREGDRGSVWAVDLGRVPRAWLTSPPASEERGIVLSLAMGYQGRATIGLRVAGIDLGLIKVGHGDSCFAALDLGHVWMTPPVRGGGRWRYRTLLVVVPWVQPAPGQGIVVEGWLTSRLSRTGASVLSYGDTWRHVRSASLARLSK